LPKSFKIAVKRAILHRIDAQPETLKVAILNLWSEIKIARMVRDSAKCLHALKGKKGLKVQLGCGDDIKLGWVNFDLELKLPRGIDSAAHPRTMIINYDLRLGLPLDDNSCDFIYSSHFFEHLEYRHGLQLIRDCYRALRPGGVFRIALPNYRGLFEAYLRGDYKYVELIDILKVLPEVEPGTETLVDHINYGVYQHGQHKCIYDEEKIILILKKIGYSSVALSSYKKGIDPNTPVRQRYSFYMEVVK
jgi:SAM-dependent methyltransferase